MSWYLVKTSFRKALTAKHFFDVLDVKSYVPCTQIKNKDNTFKKTPVLTGYVFVYFLNKIDFDIINQNPFTKDVIRRNSVPLVIPDAQMELMITHVESLYNKNDFNAYSRGDIITINHGSLKGVNGRVIELRNNKIYLQIDSLSAQVEIQYS